MKILFLTNEYPPFIYGGAGIHLENLSESLLAICSELSISVLYNGTKSYTIGDRISVMGINDLKKSRFDDQTASMTNMLNWCSSLIKSGEDFDIIHCHTWSTLLSGIYIKLLSQKPLIITCHSLDIERPWKKEVLGKMYNFSMWVEKTAYSEADAIIAVSNSIKVSLTEKLLINPDKIHVIYNGSDHSASSDLVLSELGFDMDYSTPYALFIGRLTKQKGLDYLLNAIDIINEEMQFVICAGKADSEKIEKEYLDKIGILKSKGKKILLIQNLYDKQILSCLYKNAQVFINPSIYEPYGLTIVEALSHGLPIIASNIGGPSEVLNNGNALLVDLKSESNEEHYSENLANAIIAVKKDEHVRKRMRERASSTFTQLPSWNDTARKHIEVYNAIHLSNTKGLLPALY